MSNAATPALSHASVIAGPGRISPGRVLFDVGLHRTISPAQAAAAAASSSSFTQFTATQSVGKQAYKYVMAGNNPASPVTNASATINAELVPIVLKFPNGDTWDPTATDSCDSGASPLARVQQSPLVTSRAWTWGHTSIGTGQLTDAFQRAEFWTYAQPTGINPSYGISLAWKTFKEFTINVPAADAATANSNCGNGLLAEVGVSWLQNYIQKTVIPALAAQGVSPSTVPVFLVHNAVEFTGTTVTCCDLGFHAEYSTASGIPPQTYVVADYDNSGDFPSSPDISALSHELAEWQNDPYGTNPVPAWGPIGQATGCQSNLEVGDPLSGTTFNVTVGSFTYHPQELAFFSWFYHQTADLGVNGWDSDQGTWKTFAPGCWTAAQVPLPPGGAAANPQLSLRSVACPSASACVAAGQYIDPSGNQQGLIVTGSGAKWTAIEAPLPANATGAALESVTCSSASSCTAVGDYTDLSGDLQGLIVTGSGSSWTATEAPVPADAAAAPGAYLSSVACPAASTCVATGSYKGPAGYQAFMLAGSGTSWTPTEVPMPADAAANPFVRGNIPVACSGTSSCVAATTYTDSSGGARGALITGSGTTWTVVETPLPADAAAEPNTGLYGVACPPAASCVVTGNYADLSGNEGGLLVTGAGTSWTATRAPLPSNGTASTYALLGSAACSSATSCTAVGQYLADGDSEGLIESGSGTSWHASQAPASYVIGYLNAVACPSTSACVAGGAYGSSITPQQTNPILLTGVGTHWIGVTVPLPPGATTGISLNAVGCAAAYSCVMAGYYGFPDNPSMEGLLLTQSI